jgi:hypothetical protein
MLKKFQEKAGFKILERLDIRSKGRNREEYLQATQNDGKDSNKNLSPICFVMDNQNPANPQLQSTGADCDAINETKSKPLN